MISLPDFLLLSPLVYEWFERRNLFCSSYSILTTFTPPRPPMNYKWWVHWHRIGGVNLRFSAHLVQFLLNKILINPSPEVLNVVEVVLRIEVVLLWNSLGVRCQSLISLTWRLVNLILGAWGGRVTFWKNCLLDEVDIHMEWRLIRYDGQNFEWIFEVGGRNLSGQVYWVMYYVEGLDWIVFECLYFEGSRRF